VLDAADAHASLVAADEQRVEAPACGDRVVGQRLADLGPGERRVVLVLLRRLDILQCLLELRRKLRHRSSSRPVFGLVIRGAKAAWSRWSGPGGTTGRHPGFVSAKTQR